MRVKILTTDPPDISNDTFEDQLGSDDLLMHHFNEFLNLPVFSEAVKYNKRTGAFEVVTKAAEMLSQQIRLTLLEYKSKLLADPAELAFSPLIDNSYTVLCLDREQGVQWIKRERLPLFLRSDCYFEYRLAKLLSQVDSSCLGMRLQVNSTYRPWDMTSEPSSASVPVQDGNKELVRTLYDIEVQDSVTENGDWFTLASQSQRLLSVPTPVSSLGECSLYSHSSGTVDVESRHSTPQPHRNEFYSPRSSDELGLSHSKESTPSTDSDTEFPRSQENNLLSSNMELHPSTSMLPECIEKAVKVYLTETRWTEPRQDTSAPQTPTASALENFADSLVEQVLKNAISKMENDTNQTLKSPALTQENAATQGESAGSQMETCSEGLPATEHTQNGDEGKGEELELGDEAEENQDVGDTRTFLQDFQSFLQGTPGHKLLLLWLDIERLKSLQNMDSKNRWLVRMKSRYMLTGGQCTLRAEVLCKLGLASTHCWREDKLHLVQPCLIEALLLYWCPRFWTAQSAEKEGVVARLRRLQERQLRPASGIDPNPRTVTLLPLRPSSCVPRLAASSELQSLGTVPILVGHAGSERASLRTHKHRPASTYLKPLWSSMGPLSSTAVPTMHRTPVTRPLSANRGSALKNSHLSLFTEKGTVPPSGQWESGDDGSSSPLLGSRRMERMLQALHKEPKAGFCFTCFCECSGNQLWENAVYFWTDLQEYHHLFYGDGLDPYRLQQQAQLLYSTYLCSGARMNVGVSEECRRGVYACLTPPYEELFDAAEEHVLTLLLEPWALLTTRDRATYEKVDLWEENRHVDTAQYRKLQALHRKLLLRLNQCVRERSPPPPPAEVLVEPDLWAHVPEQFRVYRLGSLLRNRLELQHFHSYLEENFASMDLMCWLDIEHFRRLPQKDRTQREEKSKDIKSKYLSRKYFFGSNSPATREQQEEVIHLGGGWGRILHDRLSGPMLAEVQSHVRHRIERKWLPLFLSTPQFAERQKLKPQVEDVVEDQISLRHRKKREVWKHVDSTWMASSKEVLAFRRALLNPVTCQQFQRFVSLKGEFLENGVLFWLEVQRYKDLFHSHCDEATIQHKVTLIINSFINSSIPPALQIDIPPEQARDILERRGELGPYVFREAQMCVFSQLFQLWPQFLSFRSSMAEELVLPLLESKKEKQKEKLQRRRRREEEERRAQEEAEQQRPSLAEGLFEDEGSMCGELHQEGETERENGRPENPTQQVSWSYSKYVAALEQEQALLQRCTQLERGVASLSLSSGAGSSSSARSVRSEGSRRSHSQRSVLSPRAHNIPQ